MSEINFSGITKIAVKGFKSIAEECEIDIRPLTILAGVNSSGKSSIMQPLLMLKQTLEALYDPGPLLIDGPNVQFTEASQFLSALSDGKVTDHFQIGIAVNDPDLFYSVKTTFRKKINRIELTDQTIISLDETVRRLFKRASQQVGEIRGIIWVNPDHTTEEQPIIWLQNDAPPEPHRQLSA